MAGLADRSAPERTALEWEAIRIWNEFAMTQEGITYQMQGYHTGDGLTVPAWKIDEHMLCARLYGQALSERNKKSNG